MIVKLKCENCESVVYTQVRPDRGDQVPVCRSCWGGAAGLSEGFNNLRAGTGWDSLGLGTWTVLEVAREDTDPVRFRGMPIGEHKVFEPGDPDNACDDKPL